MAYYVTLNDGKTRSYASQSQAQQALVNAQKQGYTGSLSGGSTSYGTAPSNTKPATTPIPSSSGGGSQGSSAASALKTAFNVAGGGAPSYQGHISYFGSPEAYAAAIKEAEAPGGRGLSDPAAAQAFKADNPQYFAPSYSSFDADYDALIKERESFIKDMGYSAPAVPGDLSREQINYSFGVTPQTYQDIYMDQAGNFWTGKTKSDAMGDMTTYRQATQEDILAAFPEYRIQQEQLMNQFQSIYQDLAQGINQSTAPLIMQQYDQMMGMINDAEAALIKRYEEAGSSVDPATQAALASLRDTVDRQRKNLMEEMSRRGLLQSGIWAQADIDLSKGELSEEQRLLSTRLSDLQSQLNQALANLTQNKIQAAGQFGTAAIQAAESEAQRRQSAIENLAKMMADIQNETMRRQSERERLAFDREKYLSEQDWERAVQLADWTGVIPEQYPGDPSAQIRKMGDIWNAEYEAHKDTVDPGNEATWTPAMKNAHAMAEAFRQAAGWGSGGTSGALTEQYMTPAGLPTYTATQDAEDRYWDNYWKQLGYETDQAKLYQSQSKASQPSDSDIKRENLSTAQTEIWQKLNSGTPIEQVEAWIVKNAGKYASAGLDYQDLVNYAWIAKTGARKPTSTGSTGNTGDWTSDELNKYFSTNP